MKSVLYKAIFISLAAGMFTACSESLLEETPKDFLAVNNLYRSTAGFESAITPIYAAIRSEASGLSRVPSMYTGTDVAFSIFSHPEVLPFESYGNLVTSELAPASNWWFLHYGALARVNLIIQEAENEDVDWDDPVDKARILAEARFFRAYFHNIMTTMFGDVPLVEEFYTDVKNDFVRTPQSEVLEAVKEDLVYAAANLPSDPASLPRGKITKWAAMHLLTEVYIHLGEYALAETTAKDIIDNGPYQLMTTRFGPEANDPKGNVFRDMFREGNVDYNDGNLETIWVIEQEWDKQGGDGGCWIRRQFVAFSSNLQGITVADSLGGRGVGRVAPTQAFVDLYEPNDIRAANNNLRSKWYYNDPDNLPPGVNLGDPVVVDPLDPDYEWKTKVVLFPSTTKWDFGVIGRGGAWSHANAVRDYPRMRLAETYLLLAEAQHLQGNNSDAAITLNAVRARSNATAITGADVDMDFILDERARELYSEEYRRLTLFRTGMFLERVQAMNPQVASAVTSRDELFPIPQSVIDANLDAPFAQNPGY